MSSFLCITVRFLDSVFHGRRDGGEPEWPPSPLRLFQSLVAAASARWRDSQFNENAASALRWLEREPAPIIIAPHARVGAKYRLYVPDNVTDKVASAWSRGNEASIADYRTEKDVRPLHLLDGNAVHFLWFVSDKNLEFYKHYETLSSATRSITHLGWGVDMVAANAISISDIEADKLAGHRWKPGEVSGIRLRAPVGGTLAALRQRHEQFLRRLPTPDTFNPVPPLSVLTTIGYHSATAPSGQPLQQRPFVAFSLLKPDGSGFRTFDTVRRTMVVAGMMRSAANTAAKTSGWSEEKIASLILGHDEAHGEVHRPVEGPRFAYLPLPSIEHRGEGQANVIGAIRRLLVTAFTDNCSNEIDWATKTLSGSSLVDEQDHEVRAILTRIPINDRMIQRYVRPAATWATVTPVILPGYDDSRGYRRRLREGVGGDEQKQLLGKLDRRIEHLLRKAIRQTGLSEELANHAQIEWRGGGFWPGAILATRYAFPNKLRRFRRLHVSITWQDRHGSQVNVPGPICLGRGRFYGLGLFAAQNV